MVARTPTPVLPSAAWTYPAMVVAAGVAVAVYATVNGWPGIGLFWASLSLAGWMSQPPTFTGLPDASKRPTAANPAEQQGMDRYSFWSALKWKVLIPGKAWLPFDLGADRKPPSNFKGPAFVGTLLGFSKALRPAAVLGFVGACAAAGIPAPASGTNGWVVNFVGAYASITVITFCKRESANQMHPRPGVTLSGVAQFAEANRAKVVAYVFGAAVLGLTCAVITLWYSPISWGGGRWLLALSWPAVWLGVLSAKDVGEFIVTDWRALVAASEAWKLRFDGMKLPAQPFLYEHKEIGDGVVTVDTFRAPSTLGSAWFYQAKNREQIINSVGAGSQVDFLSVPNLDSQQQPQPGTIHPLDVRVVVWATGAEPDVGSSGTDAELVSLLLECATTRVCDGMKMPRPVLDGIRPVPVCGDEPASGIRSPDSEAIEGSDDDDGESREEPSEPTRAAYEARWYFPEGGSPSGLVDVAGAIGGQMGVACVVDKRSAQMFFGDLDQVVGPVEKQLDSLLLEAKWRKTWVAALKQGVSPPLVQPATLTTARLSDNTEMTSLSFAVGQGQDPLAFFGFEAQLATASDAVFMTTTGFVIPQRGARPGERHKLGLTLLYSAGNVPSTPQTLAPAREPHRNANLAQKWALAGMINRAFDAAKLARPEVIEAIPLTTARSRGHIWGVKLRLYGGVTTPDVRKKIQVFAQTWGVQWLRLAPASEDIIVIYAGASPRTVKLANPDKDEFRITALDWEQAWADAKVVSTTGGVPTLTAAGRLEHNDKVQVLDFHLPQGISAGQAKMAQDKLRTNTGNSFILFRAGTDGAASIRVLCSPEDPVPFPALCDFDYIDEAGERVLPFATGVEGEPVVFDTKTSAHSLIAGGTGSGKSIALQNMIYGGIVRGWDVYIADPSKGAADFKFADPYAKAVARTLEDTAALMTLVYDEVKRRKDVNSKYGVGSFKDLPEDVRPPRLLLVLDEFTSLVTQDPVPKASDDPDAEAERMAVIESNGQRAKIGALTGRVAREARSAGITMFLATQKLNAKMLDGIPGSSDLKANLARILLGNSTYGDRQSALKNPDDAPPLGDVIPPGRGLWEPSDGKPQIVQAWYTPGEQEVLSAELEKRMPALAPEQRADLTPYLPKQDRTPGVIDIEVDPGEDGVLGTADDEIIELGSVEFSLDDLEAFVEGDEVIAGDDPSYSPPFGPGTEADAMLEAFRHGEFEPVDEFNPFEAVPVLPEVEGPAVTLVLDGSIPIPGTTALWVTPGVPAPHGAETLTSADDDSVWWVADALSAWLAERPWVTQVFVRGDLTVETGIGLTFEELLEDVAGDRLILVPADVDMQEPVVAEPEPPVVTPAPAPPVVAPSSDEDWSQAPPAAPKPKKKPALKKKLSPPPVLAGLDPFADADTPVDAQTDTQSDTSSDDTDDGWSMNVPIHQTKPSPKQSADDDWDMTGF